MIRRRLKSNQLLNYLFRRKSNGSISSVTKSLYAALLFALFFAIMIFLQILSIDLSLYDLEDKRFLGRLQMFNRKTVNKNNIFSPQKLEWLNDNSYDIAFTQFNQSNSDDRYDYFYSKFNLPDHWQEVTKSKDKFFIYSAFYDDRNPKAHYIRIIGATKTRTEEKVVCKLWYSRASYSSLIIDGITKMIRENWNLRYSAYFILCPLSNDIPIPDAVSVIIRPDHYNNERERDANNNYRDNVFDNQFISNKLPIHNNAKRLGDNAKLMEIAVCVKPLHYNYDKVLNLIEFIELNRLLGVSHFIIYNHTIGTNVNCILNSYIKNGSITVLPWNLDMVSQKEIRTEGLFAALNDCLYRSMHRFKYVIMEDIDEVIIPYQHPNLLSMLHALDNINPLRTGAYSFQNSFFYLQWPEDELLTNRIPYPITSLLKTRRKLQLNIHKQRSKCIVIPERVVEMGNHFVWEFIAGRFMVNIDPKIALLHHYRICEFGGNDCIKTNSIVDRRVHFWKDKLIESVQNQIDKLSRVCDFASFKHNRM